MGHSGLICRFNCHRGFPIDGPLVDEAAPHPQCFRAEPERKTDPSERRSRAIATWLVRRRAGLAGGVSIANDGGGTMPICADWRLGAERGWARQDGRVIEPHPIMLNDEVLLPPHAGGSAGLPHSTAQGPPAAHLRRRQALHHQTCRRSRPGGGASSLPRGSRHR